MRNDAAGLRTWWLAGFGFWALAVWAATLFGLGGGIGAPDAPLEMPALPALPTVAAADPHALDNAQAQARPLFAADRRPHPFFLGGKEESGTGTVRLTGVLMVPSLQMATLTTEQGQSLRLRLGGPAQDGWQLLSLQPRSAVVSGPSGTLNLELQVSGGTTGTDKAEGATPAKAEAAAAQPAATPAGTSPKEPSAGQIEAIRARIQARRRQAQQNQNGSSGSQKP